RFDLAGAAVQGGPDLGQPPADPVAPCAGVAAERDAQRPFQPVNREEQGGVYSLPHGSASKKWTTMADFLPAGHPPSIGPVGCNGDTGDVSKKRADRRGSGTDGPQLGVIVGKVTNLEAAAQPLPCFSGVGVGIPCVGHDSGAMVSLTGFVGQGSPPPPSL